VTLVPEKRQELTTEGGLDVRADLSRYGKVVERLRERDILVSFFVDPDPGQIEAARDAGGAIVELHTGHYSEAENEAQAEERFVRIARAVETAAGMDLEVSAGHGLSYTNVKRFKTLPGISEYSIGHSIIARAVLVGLERAVRDMIDLVKDF
jgi:pyridoxine 5-phosphate synthase